MRPILLAPNTLSSFYPGAGRIGAFRREPGLDPSHSEDWIASTTPRTGAAPLGLTTLPDGSLLADRVAADPLSWFGPAVHRPLRCPWGAAGEAAGLRRPAAAAHPPGPGLRPPAS